LEELLYASPDVTPHVGCNERSLVKQDGARLGQVYHLQSEVKPHRRTSWQLLGSSNLVDVKLNLFKNTTFDCIPNKDNLTVVSCCNSQGGIVNDTINAARELKLV
jgi:hypothetical protein